MNPGETEDQYEQRRYDHFAAELEAIRNRPIEYRWNWGPTAWWAVRLLMAINGLVLLTYFRHSLWLLVCETGLIGSLAIDGVPRLRVAARRKGQR